MSLRPSDDQGDYRGSSPPPSEAPAPGERKWIDRPVDLAQAVLVLNQASELAVDVEFVSARPTDATQTPRLALIQIADAEQCFVIDALRLADLRPLAAPFTDPQIVKIFHGVGSDVRVLAVRGIQVNHTLDIEAVSRTIFGSRESGLQAMLQRACNIRLDKSLQRSDWTQRPLAMGMYAYAARDAEMTFALYRWLRQHFHWAIDDYEEHPDDPSIETLIAPWLATFVQGDRSFSPEFIGEADPGLLAQDCVAALETLTRPTWRSRVFRAAADLILPEVASQAEQSLSAAAAEERAAAARCLGRLRATQARPSLQRAEHDAVFDVRRAAVTALEQLDLPPRPGRFGRHEPEPEAPPENQDAPWKDKLRGLLPDDPNI